MPLILDDFLCYYLQVLKAWDIKEQVCLQTLAIKFPFGHRIPEHGPFPFFLITSPINSLFITSNDCLAEMKIIAMSAIKRNKTTHWKPLCAALYNPNMEQVSFCRKPHFVGAQPSVKTLLGALLEETLKILIRL